MSRTGPEVLWDKFLALRHHMLELMGTLTCPPDEDVFKKCFREWNYYKRVVVEEGLKMSPGDARGCLYRMFDDPRWKAYTKARNYRWVRTPKGKAHTKKYHATYYAEVAKPLRQTPEYKARKKIVNARYYAKKRAARIAAAKENL